MDPVYVADTMELQHVGSLTQFTRMIGVHLCPAGHRCVNTGSTRFRRDETERPVPWEVGRPPRILGTGS
jgi:hypothetical protein